MIGSDRSGRKFDQNRVGASNQAIREKLGNQKTRDQMGVCKLVIGEQAIGRRELSGIDFYGENNQGARDWGASDH